MRAWVLVLAAGCGRIGFDPVGEPFKYSTPRPIYLYNDVAPAKTVPIAPNMPLSVELGATFEIEPDLTARTGLAFDPLTGVMSGSPSRTSPPTEYLIIASHGETVGTARITIRTAPGFYVTDLADTHDVSPTDDDCATSGGCTLRAAFEQLALFDATPRVVLVAPGTLQVSLGELVLARPTELIGAGRDATVIDGGGVSRLLSSVDLNRVTVSDLTLRGGHVVNDGGGCFHIHGGDVTLRDVVVERCTSAQTDGGVSATSEFGVYPMQVTIERVIFRNNSAPTAAALGTTSGVAGTSITIRASEFTGNTASFGSIFQHGGGPLTVTESLFADNSGGAAIYMQGGTDTHMTNVTVVANRSPDGPGGVATNNDAILRIVNSTIVDNTCATACYGTAGIGTNSGGMLTIRNSIVARNLDLEAGGAKSNCSGAGMITSLGNNLTDAVLPTNCFAAADRSANDLQLLPLEDHGGPTRTMAITTSSPAHDGGSNAECPPIDQRGYPRPAEVACDIGAFELQ